MSIEDLKLPENPPMCDKCKKELMLLIPHDPTKAEYYCKDCHGSYKAPVSVINDRVRARMEYQKRMQGVGQQQEQ